MATLVFVNERLNNYKKLLPILSKTAPGIRKRKKRISSAKRFGLDANTIIKYQKIPVTLMSIVLHTDPFSFTVKSKSFPHLDFGFSDGKLFHELTSLTEFQKYDIILKH